MEKCIVSFGDVVLVPIPWSDKEIGSKTRPAVVISRERLQAAGQIIVLGISSRDISRENEYQIINWKNAGLRKSSKIWLSRPYSINTQYAKKIGSLNADELLYVYRYFLSLI